MKKLFITTLLAVSLAASAFAKDVTVNVAAERNFKVEFKNAANVTWTATVDYTKASFILNNEKMEAYYSPEGEMIATSKSIAVESLPVSAKRTIAKKLEGYTVREAISFEGSNESSYFISADNNKESIILKVLSNGQVSIFERSSK